MEENHHEHEHHKQEHHDKKKSKKIKFNWMYVAVGLVVLLVISIFTSGFSFESELSKEDAAIKTIDYINNQVLQGQATAELKSVTEAGQLYNVKIDIAGQEIDSYVTKDGALLFPQGINMDEDVSTPTQPAVEEVTKSDKPVVELFVMSHCPYGTQIEKGIIPVVDALGDKIDFELKFVDYAMHGQKELDEELNQYCINKEQGDKLLTYLACFLEDGDSARCVEATNIDQNKLTACVAAADKEFGISADYEDQSTWRGSYPYFSIYAEENQLYGVQGSPTLVINGEQVSSGRDSASLLNTICNAFNEAPEECNVELSSTSPSPGFGYAEGSATAASCS